MEGKFKLIMLALIFLMIGCEKSDDSTHKMVNTFTMNINDQLWEPSLVGNDSCFSKFSCTYSEVDMIPFYTIKGIKESVSESNTSIKEIFRFQIMNLSDIGTYYLSDSYGDFQSYARFIIVEGSNEKTYDNSSSKISAEVRIEKMIPNKSASFTGVKGTFSGVLYNTNQNDSIVINDCEFIFKQINQNDYCQCQDY